MGRPKGGSQSHVLALGSWPDPGCANGKTLLVYRVGGTVVFSSISSKAQWIFVLELFPKHTVALMYCFPETCTLTSRGSH